MEKYSGLYKLLTDLARMTYECKTLAAALAVLRLLQAHEEWDIVRVKNRLMLAYDASPTGGDRDMLLNAVHKKTGHIVEMQITLSALLKIKTGGGYAVYKLARLLELNAAETTQFAGEPGERTVELVGKGLIRVINLDGVEVSPEIREALLSERGLLSPSCAVVKMRVASATSKGGGAIFESWAIDRVVPRAMVKGPRGSNLNSIMLASVGLVGEIPMYLLQRCANLEVLGLPLNKRLGGRLPSELGLLRRLKKLALFGCSFSGEIPVELGQLQELQTLQLHQNQLSGGIPTELGQLQELQTLRLLQNQLSGGIPTELGQLQALQKLNLSDNQLSGGIPTELGQLQALQELRLHKNNLEVPTEAPLGAKGNMAYTNSEATSQFLAHLRE
jgi:hypothetical protein